MSDKKVKKTNIFRTAFEIILVLIIAALACIILIPKGNSVTSAVDIKTEVSDETQSNVVVSKYMFSNREAKYLKMDGAYFRPADPFTHAEMAQMIYTLLGTSKVGTATFADLDENDEVYKQAITLKTLGIITGARFHKDEPTTFEEFNAILSFFGASCQSSEEDMTRRDAAVIMYGVLKRTADEDFDKIGTILDVAKTDEDFYIIADAALEKTLPVHDTGYFFSGDVLRYIDEDGVVAVNTEVDGFRFDANGKYTSGNKDLDVLIYDTISDVLVDTPEHPYRDLDGNFRYKDEHALKVLYRYVVDKFTYVPREFYEMGDTSWAADEAYTMLSTRKGNCYNFAAAFYELSRAIGYKSEIFSGTIGSEHDPHSWVEIEFNGETRLFDPEIEYSKTMGEGISFYKQDEDSVHKYNYKKEN